MKSRILQSLVPILLVIAFTPAVCRAQAEIDPDHFDSPSNASPVAKKAPSNRNPSLAYGSFFLPFDVTCAGVKLTQGHYSLSVQQSGRRDVVRLVRIANGVSSQALEVAATPRLSAEGPSGLVIDRVNQQRTLTGISLQQPGVTLFLQTGKAAGTSKNAERIPISYSVSQALPPN